MMKLRRTDAAEFERLADKTDLGNEARAMARMVLVDGLGPTAAAMEFNSSKQRVSLAVDAIRRAHSRSEEGAGWVSATVDMPDSVYRRLAPVMASIAQQKGHDRDQVLAGLIRGLDRAARALKRSARLAQLAQTEPKDTAS